MASIITPNAVAAPSAPPSINGVPSVVYGEPLSILDMNTKAVVSLKEGRLAECMNMLRDTLVQTRTRLVQYQHEQAVVGQQGEPSPRSRISAYATGEEDTTRPPLLSLFTLPLFTHRQLLAPGDDLSAHCPLFDRVFLLGRDFADPSDLTWMADGHCQNVTLGVVLYNLALCHHLAGIYKGASAEDFRVAINLYQMALSLVESSIRPSHEEQHNPEECQNLVTLLCAIFNNLANIHTRFFHVNEARNCIECLREIVSSVSSSPGVVAPCVEEDHFFFYLNLFVTAPLNDFAIAPAA